MRGTFHRRLPLQKHKVWCSSFLPQSKPHATSMQPLQRVGSSTCLTRMSGLTWQQNVTPIMRPFLCELATADSKTRNSYIHTSASKAASTHGYTAGTKNNIQTYQNEGPSPAAHTSCPSSPAAGTVPGKTQGVVLQLPPKSKPHASSHCNGFCMVLQHHVAKTDLCTHHGNKT